MTIVLIFIMIGIFFLGYLIMLKVDKFIAEGGRVESQPGRRKRGILIFGSYDVVSNARKENVEFTELKEAVVPKNDDYYSAILILSDNESKNIALCQSANQYDPDIYIIVRCVKKEMKDVYVKLGADRIIMPDESINLVLTELWRTLK